jgi:hypothetical protein
MKSFVVWLGLAVTTAAGARTGTDTAPAPSVGFRMQNVHLRLDPELALDVHRLEGRMVSTNREVVPNFDDPTSYELDVDTGEVSLTAVSLERLMNGYVFKDPDAPLRDIQVRFENGRLSQKGVLRRGVNIPFSVVADVGAAPDGTLQIHARSRTAAGIPAGGLLDLFRIHLDDLIPARDAYGLRIEGNDIFVDPSRVLPPPRVRGRLTAARIDGARLVQVFGSPDRTRAETLVPPMRRTNYIYFPGGMLRFGRLTMTDTDLQLVDADASDPFDFFPERYQRQLVAGYSKNTPSGGLITFMPDQNQSARPLVVTPGTSRRTLRARERLPWSPSRRQRAASSARWGSRRICLSDGLSPCCPSPAQLDVPSLRLQVWAYPIQDGLDTRGIHQRYPLSRTRFRSANWRAASAWARR